jgi:hypothetical protein
MTRSAKTTRISLLLLGSLFLGAPAAAAQQTIWRGRSGGYDVAWTDRDISARRASDGALVFSARRISDAEWAEMRGDHDEDVPVKEWERQYRVMSVVGSILSLEEAEYCDCGGAHPILSTRLVSYDLARSTVVRPHEVRATDLVPEPELLRALTADRLIRQGMDSAHVRSVSSVAMLTKRLELTEIQPPNDECTYGVADSLATEFALHHVESGRVAMRFSLSHYVEVCRGRYAQVGVLVTPVPRLLPDLMAADARRAGFLMKDQHAIGGDHRTRFNYQQKQ